jgi:hypothetical protein
MNTVQKSIPFGLLKQTQTVQPFMQKWGVTQHPEGWEDGLTSEEFLSKAKKMLRKKLDDRDKIS